MTAPLENREIGRSEEAVLRQLLGYYCHDMAEWFALDLQADGTYPYPVESLWSDACHVHLAQVGGAPVGFAIVAEVAGAIAPSGTRDLKEFFVVRRHRRTGLGRALATAIWNEYPGDWIVRVLQANRPALPFWRTAIEAYTEGRFVEEARCLDGRDWSYFSFEAPMQHG